MQRRGVQGIGDTDGIATDTQLKVRLDTGPVRHTLLAGLDYYHTDWTHRRDGVAAAQVLPILDILNPVPRGSGGYAANLVPAIYFDTVTKQRGIYLQDEIAIGGLRVTIGGRHDDAKDDTTNFTNAARPSRFRIQSDAFTWRAGAVYLFDNGLAPYASYAESFQPQVSDPSTALGGAQFVPVTSQQYEAGIRYQSGRNIYLTLGGYQITQQNITTPDPNGTLCGVAICLVQTGEGRVRGLELEGRASLPFGLAVIAAATHAKGKVTESSVFFTAPDGVRRTLVGNALPTYPEWLGSLFLDQRITGGPLAGLGLGGGGRYVGKHWGDTNNTLRIPDYTQFDLFLRYDFGVANPALKGLTASVNGRNIADKRFVSTCGSPQACYYGQGRSVTVRLDFRW